jgi:acyl-CoA synthetase (AMP-forming)/AMP-acid ligase II
LSTAHGLPIDHGGPVGRPFEPFPYEALDGSILDRLELVVQRQGDRLAIQDGERTLTYDELADCVGRIAGALQPVLEGRPGPIALLLGNRLCLPPAIFGTLAAGRPFFPLDPSHPLDRNRLIASHAGAAAVISDGAMAEAVASALGGDVPVIPIEAALEHAPAAEWRRPGPDAAAYVLYTSGSTGEPKGVCHTHRNCLHNVLTVTNNAHHNREDRIGVFYSGVIGAMRRIFSALLNGASLHVLRPLELGLDGLVEQIRAQRLTGYEGVPTLFRRIAGAAVDAGVRLDTLRLVRLSGDRSEWSDYELFLKVCPPDACFGVTLGSTEVSSTYAHWFVDPAVRTPGGRLPAGRETDDMIVEVVDSEGQVLPDGETGEFRVSSRYLSTGYWNATELTAAAFQADPVDPGVRVFLTGDMGFRRPDGLLEHVGRKDHMIKLRGHRIEPAELERALRAIPAVVDGAAVIRLRPDGVPRAMVAYVEVVPEEDTLLPRHLMAMISQVLPGHLMPAVIFIEPKLPRLMNYKIDRAALAKLDERRGSDGRDRASDEILDRVACAFEAVVPGVRATPDDNLLSLGGDSLQAVQLAMELKLRFPFAPPGQVVRQSQSIRQLADWVRQKQEKAATRASGPAN